MSKSIVVDKTKFDALLEKMISSDPLPYRELVSKPKLRKDGKTKRSSRKRMLLPKEVDA
jgi:hypothetical protein